MTLNIFLVGVPSLCLLAEKARKIKKKMLEEVGLTLYKCYTNVLFLLGSVNAYQLFNNVMSK